MVGGFSGDGDFGVDEGGVVCWVGCSGCVYSVECGGRVVCVCVFEVSVVDCGVVVGDFVVGSGG